MKASEWLNCRMDFLNIFFTFFILQIFFVKKSASYGTKTGRARVKKDRLLLRKRKYLSDVCLFVSLFYFRFEVKAPKARLGDLLIKSPNCGLCHLGYDHYFCSVQCPLFRGQDLFFRFYHVTA